MLAAGVSEAWLDGEGVEVTGLPTWWGPLGYRLRRDGPNALRLDLAPGLREPPGGIVVRPPLARPLAGVAGDGVVGFDDAQRDAAQQRRERAPLVLKPEIGEEDP